MGLTEEGALEADAPEADAPEADGTEAGETGVCGSGAGRFGVDGWLVVEDGATAEEDRLERCKAIASIRPAATTTIAEAITVASRLVRGFGAVWIASAAGMLVRRCAAAAGDCALASWAGASLQFSSRDARAGCSVLIADCSSVFANCPGAGSGFAGASSAVNSAAAKLGSDSAIAGGISGFTVSAAGGVWGTAATKGGAGSKAAAAFDGTPSDARSAARGGKSKPGIEEGDGLEDEFDERLAGARAGATGAGAT